MMKNQLAERVLNLILEFVYLMTGEEYIVVKRSREHGTPSSSPHISGGLTRSQNPIMDPPPPSLIHERNSDLKILELTNKIIHLLTGEDWLSSEEDLQLENEQLLRSPDKCLLENAPDRFFRPYSAPGGGNKHKRNIVKKLGRKVLAVNKPIKNKNRNVTVELVSSEEGSLTATKVYTTADHMQSTPPKITNDLVKCEEGNLTNTEINTPTDHTQTQYVCSECGKPFIPMSNIIQDADNTGENMCEKCHKKISVLVPDKSRKLHKTILCSNCGKHFKSRGKLVVHMRSHSGENPLYCSDCGKFFSSNSKLATHQRIHTGEKPFVCTECGKSFSQNSNLSTHLRTHTGEKPFTCPECGRCFARRLLLLAHRRTHTGEKPFFCRECGKYFSSRSYLVTHQRIHTGERTFSCSECGKSFVLKSYLNSHLKTHTDDKKFALQ